MKEALGLVEICGLSTAITVADAMVKTANITLYEIENTKGLGYMTIKVIGDVGAVNAAVTAGKQLALENNKFISAKVIPRPSIGVENWFCTPKKGEEESPASKGEEESPAPKGEEESSAPKGEEESPAPKEEEESPAPKEEVEEPVTNTKMQMPDSKSTSNKHGNSSKSSKMKTERNKPK